MTKSTTLLTLEIASQYGASIQTARRLTKTEARKYADWYRTYGLVCVSDSTKVNRRAAEQLVVGRKADGQFAGCDNQAWIITQAEWDLLAKTSPQDRNNYPMMATETAIAEHQSDSLQLQEQDRAHHNHPGYCIKCHTYCYGDCEA